jgi:large subunit ribosomal protein L20
MARIKRAVAKRKRKKKFFKLTKGYFGAKSRQYRTVREATKRSGNYAFVGRKLRKREFRSIWITRLNAAAREHGLSYSQFMSGLKKASVNLDRKILSELALNDPKVFAQLAEVAKTSLAK